MKRYTPIQHLLINKTLYLLLIPICWGCTQAPKTEKFQSERDNVINVRDQIKEIEIEDVLIGSLAPLYLVNDYLFIMDVMGYDKLIHIFNKNDFGYVKSIANKGQGPGEIANIGHIAADKTNRVFYVTDHGKQRIFSYNLDSVLTNPFYLPKVKMEIVESQFPDRYEYINDTLSMGLIIEPIGNYGFNQSLGKWNMNTGKVEKMKYTHPQIEKKRIYFAVSEENNMYVECYSYHDLITICTLDGDLKYNIYGDKWNDVKSNKKSYYGYVTICRDKMVALYYAGMDTFNEGKSGDIRSNLATQFIVFDLDGNYVKTMETKLQIIRFCYDKENHRLIMNLDDDIQFAYLDLNGLI